MLSHFRNLVICPDFLFVYAVSAVFRYQLFHTMASNSNSDISSIVVLNNDGQCGCCESLVPSKEIILCSLCTGRFHATCKSASNKICTASHLSHFMNEKTRTNFLYFCDPCLTSFHDSKKDANRLNVLEKNYESIENQLSEIKALCFKESVVVPDAPSKNSNPWLNSTKLKIMKNGLNGSKANVAVLEDKIDPVVNRNIISHELKDGTTVLSCSSSTDVPAIQKIVQDNFPEHNVMLQKPSKTIVRIVGFKTKYEADQLFKQLFERNPSLSSLDTPEHRELISVKPCLKDATTFQAIVKISLSLRKAIHQLKDHLYIS